MTIGNSCLDCQFSTLRVARSVSGGLAKAHVLQHCFAASHLLIEAPALAPKWVADPILDGRVADRHLELRRVLDS